MNTPRFYVFGVPDGFDLYQGDASDTSYYQLFYDGSKENTKLAVHRKANGQVSYSYLKYRMFSVEGRPGAFFGMSVVFNDEYCGDTAKLYRLFDSVYEEIIIKKKILLEEVKGSAVAQAKFLIRNFKQQEIELRTIAAIILKNIESKFVNDIYALDSTFKQGKLNLIRKINANKGNDAILNALRDYYWVSVSPEYPEENTDEVSEEGKHALKNTSIEIKDAIIKNYNKILEVNSGLESGNIDRLKSTTNEIQKTILYYLKKQPELQELQKIYAEIQNQIDGLKAALESKSAGKENEIVVSGREENGNDKDVNISESFNVVKSDFKVDSGSNFERSAVIEEPQDNIKAPQPKDPINLNKHNQRTWSKFKISRRFFLSVLIFLTVIVLGLLLLYYHYWKSETNDDCPECLTFLNQFDQCVSNDDFECAWTELVNLKEKKQDISSKQKELIEKIRDKVKHLIEENTESSLMEARRMIEQATEYDNRDDISQDLKSIIEANQIRLSKNNLERVSSGAARNRTKKDTSNNARKESLDLQPRKESEEIFIQIYKFDEQNKIRRALNINEAVKVGESLLLVVKKKKDGSEATGGVWKLGSDDDNPNVQIVNAIESNPLQVKCIKAGEVIFIYKDQSCKFIIRR